MPHIPIYTFQIGAASDHSNIADGSFLQNYISQGRRSWKEVNWLSTTGSKSFIQEYRLRGTSSKLNIETLLKKEKSKIIVFLLQCCQQRNRKLLINVSANEKAYSTALHEPCHPSCDRYVNFPHNV